MHQKQGGARVFMGSGLDVRNQKPNADMMNYSRNRPSQAVSTILGGNISSHGSTKIGPRAQQVMTASSFVAGQGDYTNTQLFHKKNSS